jgi:hypothetical protein
MSCASELLAARAGIAADAEAAYLLSVVRASCRLMLCTITSVLDLKTIEAATDGGRTQRLRRRDLLDVRALLADVLDVCRVGCSARIEQLHADQPLDLPASLEVRGRMRGSACVPAHTSLCHADASACQGDAERLHQVLLNVAVVCLHYAATGAAPGATTVALSRCSADASCTVGAVDVCVCFVVAGRVLSPAEAGAAFEPYSSHSGLALQVARFFARAMGGDLRLVCGNGCTRYELRVRLHAPGAPPPEPCDTPSPRTAAAAAAQASAAAASAPLPPPVGVALTQQMLQHLMQYSDDLFHTGNIGPDGALFVRARGSTAARLLGIDTRAWAWQDFVSPSLERHWLGYKCTDFVGAPARTALRRARDGRMACSCAAVVCGIRPECGGQVPPRRPGALLRRRGRRGGAIQRRRRRRDALRCHAALQVPQQQVAHRAHLRLHRGHALAPGVQDAARAGGQGTGRAQPAARHQPRAAHARAVQPGRQPAASAARPRGAGQRGGILGAGDQCVLRLPARCAMVHASAMRPAPACI